MSNPQAAACVLCGREMRHDTAEVCDRCAVVLKGKLERTARLAGVVTLTVARLDNVTRTGSGQPDDLGWWKAGDALEAIPLLPDLDRANRHDAAVGELSTWARLVVEERGITMPRRWAVSTSGSTSPAHPLQRLAAWLSGQVEWLRHHPAAVAAYGALDAACREIERVVDGGVSDGELIGLCACGTARYAGQANCRRCGETELEHDRNAVDEHMHDAQVTAGEAARWVAGMGLVTDTAKLRKLIWAWADRGHITAVGDGPLYRFGDVLQRVMGSPALLRAA